MINNINLKYIYGHKEKDEKKDNHNEESLYYFELKRYGFKSGLMTWEKAQKHIEFDTMFTKQQMLNMLVGPVPRPK